MIFDYKKEEVFTKTVDVVDCGNFALRATNETGMHEYYIIVKTIMGKTAILRFGPIVPDLPILCADFELTHKIIEYKENSINKEISKYINDPKKEISEVNVIEDFEAYKMLPEISEATMLD